MTGARTSRTDVIEAAGRLFARHGYHGTSMRDLGRELGLLGSSLYSHVESKEDLLVEVVEKGAALFDQAAAEALSGESTPLHQLHALVAGHVDVVVDNLDVARTFLNEARMLDETHRSRVLSARDHYERQYRSVIARGVQDGIFADTTDPVTAAIFILSILNAVERWYHPDGKLSREELVEEIKDFILKGLRTG